MHEDMYGCSAICPAGRFSGATHARRSACAHECPPGAYCPPGSASKVLRIDPATGTVSQIGDGLSGGDKYWAAAMGSDGCIYCPQCDERKVLRIGQKPPLSAAQIADADESCL